MKPISSRSRGCWRCKEKPEVKTQAGRGASVIREDPNEKLVKDMEEADTKSKVEPEKQPSTLVSALFINLVTALLTALLTGGPSLPS